VQQIKGSVVKSRLTFVEEHFGRVGLQRTLNSLSTEDRDALVMVLPVKWYPFELGKRLDDAIVSVLGRGDVEFFERLGSASAEKNLTTVHKGFLTDKNPHGFLAKAPTIYRVYYETGRRQYEKTGEKEGVLTTFDAETFSSPDCLTVIGWHKKALDMLGVRGVMMSEEECRATGGKVCRYRISWQ
jgi:hypothetical protein